jgi:hypothetical protein
VSTSVAPVGTSDPEGIYYTLWTYQCGGLNPVTDVPPGNQNDFALQSCQPWQGQGVCGVSAIPTVAFLRETVTRPRPRERDLAEITSRSETISSTATGLDAPVPLIHLAPFIASETIMALTNSATDHISISCSTTAMFDTFNDSRSSDEDDHIPTGNGGDALEHGAHNASPMGSIRDATHTENLTGSTHPLHKPSQLASGSGAASHTVAWWMLLLGWTLCYCSRASA